MVKTELVTTLKRQATKLISRIERDKRSVLITQRGRPAAYLVNVETFESLHRRIELLEGLARGEMAIREGRTLTHQQAKKKMARWLK